MWSHSSYTHQYTNVFVSDGSHTLDELIKYIPLSIQLNDSLALNYHCRLLLNVLERKLDVNLRLSDRINLIHSFINVLSKQSLELYIQIKCMSCILQLIKHDELILNNALRIEWRLLYYVLCRHDLIGNDEFTPSDHLVKSHLSHLCKLIQRTRKYFISNTDNAGKSSDSTVNDILNEFIGYISPVDTIQYRAEALITLFIPTNINANNWQQILNQLYSTSQFTDRTPITQMVYLSVFSRLAKHQLGAIDFTLLMPALLQSYMQSLELEIGGKSSSNDNKNWSSYYHLVSTHNNPSEWIGKYIAKLVAYTLQDDHTISNTNSTLSLITQLLQSIQSYFHPSNTGKWTNSLSVLISELARYYGIRRGKEYRGEVSYGKKNYLSADNKLFVQSLQSICMTAMYSKSGSLVTSSLRCLRHLSYWHSDIIFPSLLAQSEFALTDVTSAHRAMSILQALTAIAQPLINRRIYPSGAIHLQQLMSLTLPGIDSTDVFKTSYTLSWLTVLFYSMPLIEASSNVNSNNTIDTQLLPHVRQPDNIDDVNEDIRVSTLRYSDWSLELLESIINLVKTQERYAKNDYIAATLATLVYKVMRAFLGSLSYNTYTVLANKLIQHINDNVNVPAVKYWSAMASAAALIQPKYFLQIVFKKFSGVIMNSDNELQVESGNRLSWALFILAGAVKQAGGSGVLAESLVPYVSQIQSLHCLTRDHSDKLVRKASNKLLKNTLRALTTTYPAEYRSLPPAQWYAADYTDINHNKPNNKQDPYWLTLGTYQPPTQSNQQIVDVDIEWHIPTQTELNSADQILSYVTSQPFQQLNKYMKNITLDELSVSKKNDNNNNSIAPTQNELIERQLLILVAAIRGSQTVLGDINGDEYDRHSTDSFDGSKAIRAQLYHTTTTPYINSFTSKLTQNIDSNDKNASIRVQLLQYMHKLVSKVNNNSAAPAGIKIQSLLIKLLNHTLNSYGFNERHMKSDIAQGRLNRLY